MSLIMAALLAITMAIVPIATSRAAAPGVLPAVAVSSTSQMPGSHEHAAQGHGHGDASLAHGVAVAQPDCDGHEPASHHADGADCCSMGACHALQVSLIAGVFSPARTATALGAVGDEQVGGIVVGQLDRPPRSL
jgi:hypothetical protein